MSTFALLSLLLQPALADDAVRTGVVRAAGAGVPAGTVVEVLGVQGVRETVAVSAEGTFEVRWPEGSSAFVRARAVGTPPLLSEAQSLGRRTVLELRPTTTVDVQLQPATAGVFVLATDSGHGHPERWSLDGRLGWGRTDAAGRVTLEIPEGTGDVHVLALGPDVTMGLAMSVQPGASVEVLLGPARLGVFHTAGLQVARPEGVDAEGWVVVGIDAGGRPQPFDADGTLHNVAAGHWWVWVQDRAGERAGLVAVDLPPGEVVEVSPSWGTKTLSGVVVGPDGEPRAGVWLRTATLGAIDGRRLWLWANGRPPAFLAFAEATTDPSGHFELTGLLGDRWWVDVGNARTVEVTDGEEPVRLVFEGAPGTGGRPEGLWE